MLKPDLDASPADFVSGEGLAVTGELLGPDPPSDPEATRQRRTFLSKLKWKLNDFNLCRHLPTDNPEIWKLQHIAMSVVEGSCPV